MTQFAICINNESNPASLIVGKVYQYLVDDEAEQHALLRVVDEDADEEDGYLYPSSMFALIEADQSTGDRSTSAVGDNVMERDVLSRVDVLLARLAEQNELFTEAEVAADVAAAIEEARNADESE